MAPPVTALDGIVDLDLGQAVRSLSEVIGDPVLRDRGMITEIGTGDRACTVFGSPLQMGDSPVSIPAPAPVLGEHTDDVLRTWLNLSDAAIERLRDAGVS